MLEVLVMACVGMNVCMCICVCLCVCVFVCLYVSVCVHACMHGMCVWKVVGKGGGVREVGENVMDI